eukprot:6556756-Pyramimonas_sp.AAC.1
MGSQRQTCVSHSAPEADIVAADLALRKELLAALPLSEILLDRPVRCLFLEGTKQFVKSSRQVGQLSSCTYREHIGLMQQLCPDSFLVALLSSNAKELKLRLQTLEPRGSLTLWLGLKSYALSTLLRPNSGPLSGARTMPVSYTHLRAHETGAYL